MLLVFNFETRFGIMSKFTTELTHHFFMSLIVLSTRSELIQLSLELVLDFVPIGIVGRWYNVIIHNILLLQKSFKFKHFVYEIFKWNLHFSIVNTSNNRTEFRSNSNQGVNHQSSSLIGKLTRARSSKIDLNDWK